jgi:hypothetical protein
MGKLKVTIALLLATLGASPVAGQACLGLPSFAGGSVHLNGVAEFPDSARVYSGAISAGTHNGLFANLGGGQVSYTGFDEKSTLGFLEFGVSRPVRGAEICPIAGGYLGVGPDDPDIGLKVTSHAAAGGIALGLPLGTATLRIIPNAAVRYQYTSQTVEDEEFGSISETFNDTWMDLGLGIVIRDLIGIQPLAHIPVAGDNDEVTFGVFVSASTGWRAR